MVCLVNNDNQTKTTTNMRKYRFRSPVIAYKKQPKVVHSADRKAHDELFFALKSFFDAMSDNEREAINHFNGIEKLVDAYEKAQTLAYS